MERRAKPAAWAACFALALAGGPLLAAPAASWSVSSEAMYTDMPFTLTLKVEGFDEEPVPAPPALAITGCDVAFLGVSPSVSSHIQIVNGRRSEWKQVTFNYQWRVVAPATGRYQVPPLRVEQAGVEAVTQAVAFEVGELPDTGDMQVRMRLPERAVWAGETFDVAVEWYVARDVESHEFVVPLFNVEGAHVEPATAGGANAQTVRFPAAAGEVALPLVRSQRREGGRTYTRYVFPAKVTLQRAGVVDLDPVRVVARLQTGTTRDSWGFRRASYRVFRAEDEARRLTVRALPQSGRPDNFVNAIGRGFSIAVDASRSVVSVGDPIELTVRVRGDGSLTGLSLPPLVGGQALPAAWFGVSEADSVGEVDEATNSKRFKATVRVKSVEAQEIPPIAFAYFDPEAGEYRSVESRPIALSVGAGKLVGAGEVVAAPSVVATQPRTREQPTAAVATLLGAEMALSAPAQTLAQPWGARHGALATTGFYLASGILFAGALYRVRSAPKRSRNRERREALKALRRALGSAAPAREAAPAVVVAARRAARALGIEAAIVAPVLERLETAAFDPAAAEQTLDAAIVEEMRALAEDWQRKPRAAAAAAAAPLLAATLLALAATSAAAQVEPLESARAAYREALDETDRLLRVRLFAKAERALRPLAALHPQAAALQVDWGNAALGAQDAGRAVLAYRRALRLAPGDARARANLAWLRDQQPVWLPRPSSAGAIDSLLFWRGRFTPTQLLLAGAVAFAGAVLLLAPWSPRQPRWLRSAAVPLLLAWGIATASALLAENHENALVVVADGTMLRTADSLGAAPAFANPLPAGTELARLEARQSWLRVSLADGTSGWLPAASAAAVVVDSASAQG